MKRLLIIVAVFTAGLMPSAASAAPTVAARSRRAPKAKKVFLPTTINRGRGKAKARSTILFRTRLKNRGNRIARVRQSSVLAGFRLKKTTPIPESAWFDLPVSRKNQSEIAAFLGEISKHQENWRDTISLFETRKDSSTWYVMVTNGSGWQAAPVEPNAGLRVETMMNLWFRH